MIQGYFSDKGELFFEINFIAADGSVIPVDALLDTGFTDWLAINIQDVDSLEWTFIEIMSEYLLLLCSVLSLKYLQQN